MSSEPFLADLAGLIGRVRGHLLTAQTAEHAVQLLAEAALDAVPGATGAGVTLIRAGEPTSTGYTDEAVAAVDALQYATGQGPCLAAWSSRQVVRVEDTDTDPRWPHWGAAAVQASVRSCLSVPLVNGKDTIGALKVYSDAPAAFTDTDQELLVRLSSAAAALLGHIQTSETPSRLNQELTATLRLRDNTQLAKGILMGRHGLGEDAAHAWLLHSACAQGRPVAEVAAALITAQPTS